MNRLSRIGWICASVALAAGWVWASAGPATRPAPRTRTSASRPASTRPATSAPALSVPLYTKDNAPATPKVEDLELRQSVSQYGITWTFDKPARVGRFILGDWYVVGPVTVKAIDPNPLFGASVPEDTIDATETKEFKDKYCRNGSVLNLVPVLHQSGFDSRMRHGIYDPALTARLPIEMKPGDALVSTASKGKMTRSTHYSPVASVAVLTCLKDPAPADAFRPAYTDRQQTVYLSRDLKRGLLPTVARVESTPEIARLVEVFYRPWMEYNIFHEDHAPYQMGGYGQGLARRGGDTALALCLDFPPKEKEPLLVGYVQFGIDLWGMLKAGYGGWEAWGGWNSGHKHPIVLAGVLLGDEKMAFPSKTYPKVSFQEDEQTGYGKTWTGAPVVFQGHSGVDANSGVGRTRGRNEWGPYEHKHPSQWNDDNWQSEGYRRCCTSRAWVGTALAAKLMKLEPYWAHDAFFDYVDRWMTEDETEALKVMAGLKHSQPLWAHEGQVEIKFHEDMWKKYRATLSPAPDAWKARKPVEPPAAPASGVSTGQ